LALESDMAINWSTDKKRRLMRCRGTESAADTTVSARHLKPKLNRPVSVSKAELRKEAAAALAEWSALRTAK
jgi:hypothetical protein